MPDILNNFQWPKKETHFWAGSVHVGPDPSEAWQKGLMEDAKQGKD